MLYTTMVDLTLPFSNEWYLKKLKSKIRENEDLVWDIRLYGGHIDVQVQQRNIEDRDDGTYHDPNLYHNGSLRVGLNEGSDVSANPVEICTDGGEDTVPVQVPSEEAAGQLDLRSSKDVDAVLTSGVDRALQDDQEDIPKEMLIVAGAVLAAFVVAAAVIGYV